ncbi:MAG: FtsW/RodA/SpoVE family cell cycle protein, partial [Clostridiales bacterium]|nr:FtsW/RodA/SpoVE family cell cycle protein [Clostridiales bacterium]
MKPALKTALPVGVDEDLRGLPRGYIKNKKDTLDKQADKKKKEKPKKPEKTLKGFETPPAIKKFFAFDKPAAACALALSLLGLLFIYSASSYNAEITFGNPFHYVITQAAALGIGLFLMIAISYFDPTKLVKFRFVILGVSLVLLALVFVPVIGVESYGAKRWLNLGFFTIQPSEFAKFGLVIFIAAQASKKGVSTFKTMLVPLLAGIAVAVLLMLEPNMSITVCVIMVVFIMLFFCGAKISHLAALIVPAFAGGVGLILMEPYRL